ncbi:Arc family DNA-binding protein [Ectopseudomonas chengduensis]|uniref:Arc family DNA-binding protein n=1 Tax=Ectopseudomonas chengduensis TaxID=489632 RepID=UPI000B852EFF|nr:Arc family DNA-binding protein [Pseudomonas chengduensis]MBP3063655.1 Arc family DNA-binding protein [Pseudomonas chengduensis]NNB73466.1 Arc family DNA-binding protein [Pseudomonas chengduensis]
MSRTDPQFNLRIPAALKTKVEEAAKHNKRSATAEIIARLEESFSPEIHRIIRAVEPATKGPLPDLEELQLNLEIVLEQLKHLAAAKKK